MMLDWTGLEYSMYSNILIAFRRKKKSQMTKTSVDVYVLFTQVVGLTNVYEVLLIICNTDTNLYDFI